MKQTINNVLKKAVEAHKAGNIQEAHQFYTAILEIQPNHPDVNHNMGVLAIGMGKIEKSLPFFKKALKINPQMEQYWLSYFDSLFRLNRITEAKNLLKQAKNHGIAGQTLKKIKKKLNTRRDNVHYVNNPPPKEQIQILVDLYNQGELQKALEKAIKLSERFPNSDIIYNIVGAVNLGLKNFDAAINNFKKATKINSIYADAYNNMGNAFKGKGEFISAINSYKKAIKIKPNYSEAFYNLGNAFKDKGDLDSAIESYKRTIKINPDNPNAYNNMGNAFKDKGDLDNAIDSYKRAIKIKPNNHDAYYNLGNALKNKGNLEKAIDNFKQAIKIKPNNYEAHNNMGNAFKDRGDLENALNSYRQAIEIKPDYAEAYNNIGIAFKGEGDLENAMNNYKQAIGIKPDYAEPYNNMGIVFKDKGDLKNAVNSYRQAIQIKPDFAEAYNNLGKALQDEGNLEQAIDNLNRALVIKPNLAESYYTLGSIFKNIRFSAPEPDLAKIFINLMKTGNYVRPGDIADSALSLIKTDPAIKKILKLNLNEDPNASLSKIISKLASFPLLIELMKVCPIPCIYFEKLFTSIRQKVLSSLVSLRETTPVLNFLSALAQQCLSNEYVYCETVKETDIIVELERQINDRLVNKEQPQNLEILILASYRPIAQYHWAQKLALPDKLSEIQVRFVDEPSNEKRIAQEIPILGEISDEVSIKVKEQYEESPYPRWISLKLAYKPETIQDLVENFNLKLSSYEIKNTMSPQILIAGCGTGQHSIHTASRFKNSKILAVDLSKASLAYAVRKTNELGINNVNYSQGDILNLSKLNRQFDIIESSGVLHHMDEPLKGWKALTNCLKSGGLMRIGLYSKLARAHIIKIRQEIAESGIPGHLDNIREYRTKIIESQLDRHKMIMKSADFYSLSTVRDLIFHVQEHQFTLTQIKKCLKNLGLVFCGFDNPDLIKKFESDHPNTNDLFNLDKWNEFELNHERAFAGMYQFWCQKL